MQSRLVIIILQFALYEHTMRLTNLIGLIIHSRLLCLTFGPKGYKCHQPVIRMYLFILFHFWGIQ